MILSWNEKSRYLEVQVGGGTISVVPASHESVNPTAKKKSTTYRFERDGKVYRIQFQVTG